jgi:flagellar basal body rod protein FlgG
LQESGNAAAAQRTHRRAIVRAWTECSGWRARCAPRGRNSKRRRTTSPTSAATPSGGSGRRFDLALLGPGSFLVDGGRSRDGAFTWTRDGRLIDDRGRRLHGSHGPLSLTAEATIEPDGTVREAARAVDRLSLPAGTTVRSGALETSNADTIGETLAILNAQRAFETAQKTFAAIDETRRKAVDDVGRLR